MALRTSCPPSEPSRVLVRELDRNVVQLSGGHFSFLFYPSLFAQALMEVLKDT
ncbi:hypothetical protein KDAU_66500 [Dictyobacter aurantiacus]|uniref:Alpha/beta hydrolase n=1 Tax=Dictyobacter aurantiacus TaxID=1936993 RepID=A0A401ZR24_9CHLR|nr:hypothetical protein KDAU_66500 [Dictyobacter aurantiacus]